MVAMDIGEVLSTAIVGSLIAAIATMFWFRLNHLEQQIVELRREMREELASIRSDMVQIALAVGAASPGPRSVT